jgi:hypothetical protein
MPFEKMERRGHNSFVHTLHAGRWGRIPDVKEVADEPEDDSLLFHAARWRDGGSDVSPGATESSTDSCLQDAAQSAYIDVRDDGIRFSSAVLQPDTHTHAAWISERHLQRSDRDDAPWAHQDRSPLQRGSSRLPRAHASTWSAMVAMMAARASPARCAGALGA